jgi:hypothetical protein
MQLTKKGNSTIVQVLVKWSTLSRDLATWEDYYVLRARYPSAPTWGQSGSQGGSNVVTDTGGPMGRMTSTATAQPSKSSTT